MEVLNNVKGDQRNGNLHINLSGQFTAEMAHQLTSTMIHGYQGRGNIFIHTENITEIAPDSRQIFGDLVGEAVLPLDNIYMIGSKGFEICLDASKVIIHDKKKHKCTGRCKECRCHLGHGHSHDHEASHQ
jgi:hypothetical protein